MKITFDKVKFDLLLQKYSKNNQDIYIFYEIRRFIKSQRFITSIPPEYLNKIKIFGFSDLNKRTTKTKVAFIGHSYHCKTLSSSFFLAELDKIYDVDVFFSQSWKGIPDDFLRFIGRDYNNCIYWQVFPDRALSHPKNTVVIPMWDAVSNQDNEFWKKYKDFSFICFCNKLHKQIQSASINSIYVQYIPESLGNLRKKLPRKKPVIYFWQRNYDITWDKIKPKLNKTEIERIIICDSVDPGFKFIAPTQKDIEEYKIEIVGWSKTKVELLERLRSSDIYIAPRFVEGIGLSMLDAMSEGCVIASADYPTMNEYIDNEIGYTVNFNDSESMNLSGWYSKHEKMRCRFRSNALNEARWCEVLVSIFKDKDLC